MVLDPHRLIAHHFAEVESVLTARDASLYALGIGLGNAPHDAAQLRYIYEQDPDFSAVPTQPVTMGFFRWVLTPELGIDVARVVHGEERLTLHGPIPTEGRIRAKLRVLGVSDKGAGRGALVSTRREIRLEDTHMPFATVETTTFCRGDGGCGSAGEIVELSESLPDRSPDSETTVEIGADSALIYRLSGDLNPLHVDPAYAAQAGFDKPILHGLCTLAMTARPIWSRLVQPSQLRQIGCRFSGFVFPGDKLSIQLWKERARTRFRAQVGERTVIDNGVAHF